MKNESGVKESEIARQIRDFLKLNQIYCWPVKESAWSYQGLADVCAVILGGRHLEIEVKKPGFDVEKVKKKPTKQSEHLERVRQHGGIAFYATSVKEVNDKLKAENIILRCSM